MSLLGGYTLLARSNLARFGERVGLPDGNFTLGIPNRIDEFRESPGGEVQHHLGWELVCSAHDNIRNGDIIIWRDHSWIVNDVSPATIYMRVDITSIDGAPLSPPVIDNPVEIIIPFPVIPGIAHVYNEAYNDAYA